MKIAHTSNHQWHIVILLIALICAWGFSWPLMKMTLDYISPLWMGVARMSIACVCLFIVVVSIGQLALPTRRDIPVLLSNGLLLMGLFTALIHMGLSRFPAGQSAILVFTNSLWIAILNSLIFRESLSKLTKFGLLLGFLGIVVMFNPLNFDRHNPEQLAGASMLLSAAVVWACVTLHVRHSKTVRSTIQLMPWQAILATLLLIIFACIFEPNPHIDWSPALFALLAYTAPVATAFGYFAITYLSKHLHPVTLSIATLGVPLVGELSSIAILNNPMTLSIASAMLLIFAGLTCVALKR